MPGPIAEFHDPRLVAVFDSVNAYEPGTQPDFYRQLATDLRASTVVDLGCGTGVITCELARHGFGLIGVEPSTAMLDVARERPYADEVAWVGGDATDLGRREADLAIMSGHVAQFFLDDDEWSAALAALHIALRPGGTLAFETRDPDKRAWERWTSATRHWVVDPVTGPIQTWTEAHEVGHGIVTYTNHYLLESTGEELTSPAALRFRTLDEVNETLADAGFSIEHVYGDWDRRPVGPTTGELIVVARA